MIMMRSPSCLRVLIISTATRREAALMMTPLSELEGQDTRYGLPVIKQRLAMQGLNG